jgi:hypothetical protein
LLSEAQSLRRLRRFCHLINADKIFGTLKQGILAQKQGFYLQNRNHRQMKFSVHAVETVSLLTSAAAGAAFQDILFYSLTAPVIADT